MFEKVVTIAGIKRVRCYKNENHDELDELPSVTVEESLIAEHYTVQFLERNRTSIGVNKLETALSIAKLYIDDIIGVS